MCVTSLKLDPGYRMIRIGFGQFDSKWFFRVDLWAVAIRVTRK